MLMIASILLNEVAWRLEGDVGRVVEEDSVTARGRCERGENAVTLSMAVVQDCQLEFGCDVAVMVFVLRAA